MEVSAVIDLFDGPSRFMKEKTRTDPELSSE